MVGGGDGMNAAAQSWVPAAAGGSSGGGDIGGKAAEWTPPAPSRNPLQRLCTFLPSENNNIDPVSAEVRRVARCLLVCSGNSRLERLPSEEHLFCLPQVVDNLNADLTRLLSASTTEFWAHGELL